MDHLEKALLTPFTLYKIETVTAVKRKHEMRWIHCR